MIGNEEEESMQSILVTAELQFYAEFLKTVNGIKHKSGNCIMMIKTKGEIKRIIKLQYPNNKLGERRDPFCNHYVNVSTI